MQEQEEVEEDNECPANDPEAVHMFSKWLTWREHQAEADQYNLA